MKQNPTTYASTTHLLLHRALNGDRQAQAMFDYGRPEVTQESDDDEESALHDRDRAKDMNEYRRL